MPAKMRSRNRSAKGRLLERVEQTHPAVALRAVKEHDFVQAAHKIRRTAYRRIIRRGEALSGIKRGFLNQAPVAEHGDAVAIDAERVIMPGAVEDLRRADDPVIAARARIEPQIDRGTVGALLDDETDAVLFRRKDARVSLHLARAIHIDP